MFKFFKRNKKVEAVTTTPKMLRVTFKSKHTGLLTTRTAPTVCEAWGKMDWDMKNWLCWGWEEIEN